MLFADSLFTGIAAFCFYLSFRPLTLKFQFCHIMLMDSEVLKILMKLLLNSVVCCSIIL